MKKRAVTFFARKYFFLGLVALIISIGGGFFFKDEIKNYFTWRLDYSVNEPLEKFSAACLKDLPAKTDTQKIINLRHCIYTHTVFSTDKKMQVLWMDRAAMMKWLNDYATQSTKTPPPMECFYRARTLSRALKLLGYKAHTMVVTHEADNFYDHVTVEVFNPDTNKWEIQDPSFDVQYVSKKDKSVAGPKEWLTWGFDKMQPCNFDGKCGWDLKTPEDFDLVRTQDYMSSAYVRYDKTLYLGRGFDEHVKRNVYGKKLSFCQWEPEFCQKIIRYDR